MSARRAVDPPTGRGIRPYHKPGPETPRGDGGVLLRSIQAARRYTWRSGSVIVLAMLAMVLAACSGTRTNDFPTSDEAPPGFFPGEVVTEQGNASAALYMPIFLVAVVIFLLVEGIVLYVTLRFRRKATDTQLPPQTHGNNRLELVWTAIPAIVVLVMFVGSFVVLTKVEATTEDPAVVVDVTGFQWQWKFEYPETPISLTGAGRDGPEMVVPINEPVRIRLHATDVIHAFYVPAFFYKKDVVPGRVNEFEVVIEKPGTYGGQCAEFCGLAHADMYFTVRAVERAEYDAWREQAIADALATPTPPPPPPSGEPGPPVGEMVKVLTTAEAPLEFNVDRIQAASGTQLTVEYLNDSPLLHNIAFFEGSDPSAPRIAATEIREGPGDVQTTTFDVPAEPGDYYFHCDVHPIQMVGTFEVTA